MEYIINYLEDSIMWNTLQMNVGKAEIRTRE